jgi:DNA helicase-2/ATP-dependent DNA helicase PcrA
MEILKRLNPSQKAVVLNPNGPCMVLAGAGSGKTGTITAKIAYLITEKNIKPFEILAVTFTNKAASEMKHRVCNMLNVAENSLNIFTFHSFCAMMLRRSQNLDFIKINKNFVIYDDSDCQSIIKTLLKKYNDQEAYSPYDVLSYINRLKNNGYRASTEKSLSYLVEEEFHQYYIEYEQELQKSNAIDFGGLIIKSIELLEASVDERNKYQRIFKYVMVDEYQDTNRSQFDLINILAEIHKNICIVLDIDQSIYSFRDANIQNTLDFEKIYPDYKLIKLEENYRSTKKILNAANHVIKNNVFRKDKTLYSNNEDGENIQVIKLNDQNAEADLLSNWVKTLIAKNVHPNEIAIFFRNNAMSRALEESFRRKNIPYILYGGLKFFDRKEIKDIIAYMKLAGNIKDNQAFKRIVNTPVRGLGSSFLDKVEMGARDLDVSIYEYIISDKIDDKSKKKLMPFISIIESIRKLVDKETTVLKIYDHILDVSNYTVKLENSKAYEDMSRLDNIKEFRNSAVVADENGQNLQEFINSISLGEEDKSVDRKDCVFLMTIHSAKGLEFEYVGVVGNEDGVFPSNQAIKESDQQSKGVEEERRLFYVCVTRAKKVLYLTYVSDRMLYGERKQNRRSRFLNELPKDCITETNLCNEMKYY